jgi:hypothetical protein
MRADDDGFINNPKRIQRIVGASDDDCKLLVMKRFIIAFESGVIVIKHWRIHNYIRNDRKKETNYTEEMALLTEKENGTYSLKAETPLLSTETSALNADEVIKKRDEICMSGKCQSSDGQVTGKCQHRLGKDSIGKYSIDIEGAAPPSSTRHKYGTYKNVLLSDDDMDKLKAEFSDYEERIERLSDYIAQSGKSYKSHLAVIRNWAKRDKEEKKSKAKEASQGSSFDTDDFFAAAIAASRREMEK